MTAACIAIALLAPIAMGLPLRWVIGGCKALSKNQWISAPFLGIAALVILLQNLVYANVPIRSAAPWVWLAIGVAWVIAIFARSFRTCLSVCPRGIVAVAVAAYLIQGSGLLKLGAAVYCGRGWNDEYNYTAIAQFLVDEKFQTDLGDLGQRPYLIEATKFKADRLGQSVIQGFFAASLNAPAKALFEPTILLSPALVALAIYLLCRKLGMEKLQSLITAATAGLLPAVALVHLESFLSHALAIPLLLYYLSSMHDFVAKPSLSRLLEILPLLGGTTAIYTEFLPIFLAISALTLIAAVLLRCLRLWKATLALLVITAAPVILIPGQWLAIRQILPRVGLTLAEAYPWALSRHALGPVWLGDIWSVTHRKLADVFAILATGVAALGLLKTWWGVWIRGRENRAWHSAEFRRSLILLFAVSAVAALPLMILAKDRVHPYQFYKSLLTVSPLLVVGISLLSFESAGLHPRAYGWCGDGHRCSWRGIVLASILLTAFSGTRCMVRQSTQLYSYWQRSCGHLWHALDFRDLQAFLEREHGKNLLVCAATPLHSCWITYLARHNRVWQGSPYRNDNHYIASSLGHRKFLIEAGDVPDEVLILTCNDVGVRVLPEDEGNILLSNQTYQLWKSDRYWAVPLKIMRVEVRDKLPSPSSDPSTQDMLDIEIIANHSGLVHLHTRRRPAGIFQYWKEMMRIRTDRGYSTPPQLVSLGEGVTVPVESGKTTITLEPVWPLYEERIPRHEAFRWPPGDGELIMRFKPSCEPGLLAAK
jgi:hypothetical protein